MRTSEVPDRILLDTHAWIWSAQGDADHLGPDVQTVVARASREGGIFISAISVWEVAMLEAKGRIHLNLGCLDWVRRSLDLPNVQLVPLSPDIAVASARLPGEPHGDPADRILIASARVERLALVTLDEKIRAYGRSGHVRILP